MNPHYWNPAGRLWALLVYSLTKGPADVPVLALWADYLGLDAEYSPELFSALGAIIRLPGQIRDRIASGDVPEGDTAAVLAAVTKAESAVGLSARLDATAQELRDRFDPETLSTLKMTSVVLNESMPASRKRRGQSIDQVRDRAMSFSGELSADSSIDSQVRDDLARHAAAVLWATSLVSVAGPDALCDELYGLVGLVAVRPDVSAALQHSAALSDGYRQLIDSLSTFDARDLDAS